jgi:hypothetical protein
MKHFFFCLVISFIYSLNLIAQKTINEEPLLGSSVKKSLISDEIVPPAFNPDKHILLVMHLPKRNNPDKTNTRVTGVLKKVMDKYYSPYRYVIVTPKQLIDSSKYADTSVYRYVLGNSVTSYARVDGGYTKNLQTGIRTPNLPLEVAHTVVAFRFHDRSKDIYYRYSKSNSFIGDSLRPLFDEIKMQSN